MRFRVLSMSVDGVVNQHDKNEKVFWNWLFKNAYPYMSCVETNTSTSPNPTEQEVLDGAYQRLPLVCYTVQTVTVQDEGGFGTVELVTNGEIAVEGNIYACDEWILFRLVSDRARTSILEIRVEEIGENA